MVNREAEEQIHALMAQLKRNLLVWDYQRFAGQIQRDLYQLAETAARGGQHVSGVH